MGNIANVNNAGVIPEPEAVKDSEPLRITVASNDDPWNIILTASKFDTLQLR